MNNARFFEVVEITRTEGSLILLFSKNPSGTYQFKYPHNTVLVPV
jgi:hypothetical protein